MIKITVIHSNKDHIYSDADHIHSNKDHIYSVDDHIHSNNDHIYSDDDHTQSNNDYINITLTITFEYTFNNLDTKTKLAEKHSSFRLAFAAVTYPLAFSVAF